MEAINPSMIDGVDTMHMKTVNNRVTAGIHTPRLGPLGRRAERLCDDEEDDEFSDLD